MGDDGFATSKGRRHRKLSDIVGGALEQPAGERGAWVAEACGDDGELRAEVEALLAAVGDGTAPGESFLDDPALPRAGDGVGEQTALGAFVLERRLEEGGMGMVYLARRREDFEQRVAIKLIRPGMTSREIVSRFEHERQILAGLEHPNIARLLGGGADHEERPYFVMEYVEGVPIDRYCRQQRLSLPKRLELFTKVCRAVQFAHRRSVLHRDLKPANILVTPEGEPKLLDFGIAKLLGEDNGETTRIGTPGTPRYASPEQLEGDPLTTASDVYSLGVLLYSLLGGRRYDEGLRTDIGRAKALLQYQPPPPSRHRVEPAERRFLAGDLDAIVLEALRPEPGARYPSVDELLADLERHRLGYPVRARRGRWTYRTGKMLRRNRGRFLGALAALVLIAVSLVAVVERRQRTREARLVEILTNYIYDVFEAGSPREEGKVDPEIQQLLEQGVEEIELAIRDYPEQSAAFLSAIGRTYRHYGDYQRAEELLRESLARRREIHPPIHEGIATSCNNLALVLRETAQYAEAEDLLREALEIYREREGPRSGRVASALGNLGGIRRARGDREEAVEYYRQSLELKRRLYPPQSRTVALALNNLGKVYEDLGELERAAELFVEALDTLTHLHAVMASDETVDPEALEAIEGSRATVLHNFGGVLRRQGDLPGAAWRLAESLEHRRASYPKNHRKIAEVERSMALLERDQGQLDAAMARLETARDALLASLGEDHPEVAFTLHEMATVTRASGDLSAARELAEHALAIEGSRLDPGHWRSEATRRLLGELEAENR